MNNRLHILSDTKAGFFTCLFLSLFLPRVAASQDWEFDLTSKKAYALTLDLQAEKALQLLQNPRNAQQFYVISLAQALDLFVSEDGKKYEHYRESYEKRIDEKLSPAAAEDLFLHAEMRLQWAFIHFKFGHELDAVWNLRQACLLAGDCRKRFPDFKPIKKTSGLLNVIIGSVPEKHHWLLGLLGIEGSVTDGLNDLNSLISTENPFSLEATLIYSMIHGYILQDTRTALDTFKSLQKQYPENRLVYFLGAAASIKNSQSEEAIALLERLEEIDTLAAMPYSYYLKGEAYLHRGDYLKSIMAYQWFIDHYKGQNYLKDAHYKMGICYLLNGDTNKAKSIFDNALTIGKETSEADKHAARNMGETKLPHIGLTKIRYHTDGGYYDKASQSIEEIKVSDLPERSQQVEYYYRKARLAHKTYRLQEATSLYLKVIAMSDEMPLYFAPNSCLQLGYLYLQEGNFLNAQQYFKKATQYPHHPYKNSIDIKARSALSQLKSRK